MSSTRQTTKRATLPRCRDCGVRGRLHPCGNCDGCCVHWDYDTDCTVGAITMTLPNEPYRSWNSRRHRSGQSILPAILTAGVLAWAVGLFLLHNSALFQPMIDLTARLLGE